jgi:hypothetical protein
MANYRCHSVVLLLFEILGQVMSPDAVGHLVERVSIGVKQHPVTSLALYSRNNLVFSSAHVFFKTTFPAFYIHQDVLENDLGL